VKFCKQVSKSFQTILLCLTVSLMTSCTRNSVHFHPDSKQSIGLYSKLQSHSVQIHRTRLMRSHNTETVLTSARISKEVEGRGVDIEKESIFNVYPPLKGGGG